jgi:hypothetical protein
MSEPEKTDVQAPIIRDIDQIAGANRGHMIALETVLGNGTKQWVCINVEDIPRLFAKFMSAAHHARDERKASSGSDPLGDVWRNYETLRARDVTVSAVQTKEGERRVIVLIDGAADLRIPFHLTPQGAKKLSANLLQMAEAAEAGRINKPPKKSSHH